MASHTTATRAQAARRAIAESAVQVNTLVRISCDRCAGVSVAHRDHNGAIEHARANPGHVVTVHVLQATSYGRTEVAP